MRLARVATVVLCLCAAGCHRTVYSNLQPQGAVAPAEPPAGVRAAPKAWQSFFIYGLAPDEQVVDAAGACGGSEHVQTIETRQTFLQGLVAAVAGFYINIYSPWNGAVKCDHSPKR